jgi:CheY-like chemotaxis protein
VEDDALLRSTTVDILEDEGFNVLSAESADEAIDLLETRADIKVLFTDIEMPGSMDGLKLSSAVRDRWPPVEIVLTSGRYQPPAHEMPQRSLFFAKPADMTSVARVIRDFCANP